MVIKTQQLFRKENNIKIWDLTAYLAFVYKLACHYDIMQCPEPKSGF